MAVGVDRAVLDIRGVDAGGGDVAAAGAARVTANIAMFVPLGFLFGLALARKAWWLTLFLIPASSGGSEFVQGIALEERVSTALDVLANTVGGYVGLLIAMVLRAMIHVRDRTKGERELWERRRAAALAGVGGSDSHGLHRAGSGDARS